MHNSLNSIAMRNTHLQESDSMCRALETADCAHRQRSFVGLRSGNFPSRLF